MPQGYVTPPEVINKIQHYAGQGMSGSEIARKVGVAQGIVSTYAPQRLSQTKRRLLLQIADVGRPAELSDLRPGELGGGAKVITILHSLRKAGLVKLVEDESAGGSSGHHVSVTRIEITPRARALLKLPAKGGRPNGHTAAPPVRDSVTADLSHVEAVDVPLSEEALLEAQQIQDTIENDFPILAEVLRKEFDLQKYLEYAKFLTQAAVLAPTTEDGVALLDMAQKVTTALEPWEEEYLRFARKFADTSRW